MPAAFFFDKRATRGTVGAHLTIMPKKGLTTASHSQITRACGNARCRHLPETPFMRVFRVFNGAIAQLGERLLCKQEVVGSIPSGSTNIPFRSAICLLGSIAPRRQSVLPGWLQLCISGHCCPHVTAWAHRQFVSSCVSCKPRIHAPGSRDRCHNILSAGTLITGPVSIKVSGPSGSGYV